MSLWNNIQRHFNLDDAEHKLAIHHGNMDGHQTLERQRSWLMATFRFIGLDIVSPLSWRRDHHFKQISTKGKLL